MNQPMSLGRLQDIVDAMPATHRQQLASAHTRYMALTGVCQGEVSGQQILQDREAFKHLVRKTSDGRPRLSDEDAAEFMSAVTGINQEQCLIWEELDFLLEHGENFTGESASS